jgi:uncharacterized membrane protein YkoI
MTLSRTFAGVAALAACALAGAAVAAGAGSATKAAATTTTSAKSGHTPETPLTGDVAAKAKAAAIAKVGGIADRASTENDSSNATAAYEVQVAKADGTDVKVILDKNYNVLSVETRGRRGGHDRGSNGETPLTGDVATQAKAAAIAKVGGSADRASTENDSSNATATYEVQVAKADGTHVKVILDKNYNVLSVETALSGRPSGGGEHNGLRR